MSAEIAISHIERLDLTFAPQPWAYALDRRAEIDAFFATQQRAKPALWNGRVLLLHRHRLEGGVLRGAFLETDFASFTAWRHRDRPPAGVTDCFGAAAVLSVDGAFVVGVMAAHTANAGRIYFPCGTPDPGDIVDGRVDFDRSIARELKEETGLAIDAFDCEPGWTAVGTPGQIALIKVARTGEGATALRARILDYLARQRQPELADIRLVRGPADLDPAMPAFMTAFLESRWG
jgi:8-oxo-dGTP pyrophosphatase MutT (NUDIX family)